MMPFAGRVTASLQAARRLFTGDGRLEDEPPDNQENMTTVPVAAVKICNSSAAHDEPKEKKRKLRRDIEDAAAQIDLMTAVHDTLQAQVNSAAVTTLRTARAAADDDDSKQKKARPTAHWLAYRRPAAEQYSTAAGPTGPAASTAHWLAYRRPTTVRGIRAQSRGPPAVRTGDSW